MKTITLTLLERTWKFSIDSSIWSTLLVPNSQEEGILSQLLSFCTVSDLYLKPTACKGRSWNAFSTASFDYVFWRENRLSKSFFLLPWINEWNESGFFQSKTIPGTGTVEFSRIITGTSKNSQSRIYSSFLISYPSTYFDRTRNKLPDFPLSPFFTGNVLFLIRHIRNSKSLFKKIRINGDARKEFLRETKR